ncbi:MAG: 7-cyano-7-deazaguanine synthase QueC [Pseudomonadales bacterium]|nr:7-cyano-7-deazaguanine synthase QueC [Pseudomonadales bacterium]
MSNALPGGGTKSQPKAVILLSGGLDSTTILSIAQAEGFECYALSFSYGQRQAVELESAYRVAKAMSVAQHKIAEIDLRMFGGSALTADISVPKGRSSDTMGEGIPVTYVPARNTIFLAYALAWADVIQSNHIFIGVNALDYSGYPDCRPEYIEAFEGMANLATKMGVEGSQRIKIVAPLLHLSKAEIIQQGMLLGVDYTETISCYDPDHRGRACGECDACILRRKGFSDAGVPDPTAYVL